MSPQDAMLHLKQSMQHNGAAAAAAAAAASANAAVAAAADPFKAHDGPYPKGKTREDVVVLLDELDL